MWKLFKSVKVVKLKFLMPLLFSEVFLFIALKCCFTFHCSFPDGSVVVIMLENEEQCASAFFYF